MPTQCSRDLFGYEAVEGRQVVAAFDGGEVTCDAGASDRAIGLIERFAICIDARALAQQHRGHVSATGVRHRARLRRPDRHDRLRHDPVLATLAGKLRARRKDCAPLAGKSTLNRLMRRPSPPLPQDQARRCVCSSTSSSRRTNGAAPDHP